jgi:hypothetical protein
MPFLDAPDPITAILTDLGRINLARAALGELSFTADSFAVGRGGYSMVNPVKITPLQPGLTALEDHYFPTSPGTKPIENLEFPTPKTLVANCRLARDDAQAGLGEIGLYCKIVYSTVPSEIGTLFLFAIAHYPLWTKTNKQVVVYRVITQF